MFKNIDEMPAGPQFAGNPFACGRWVRTSASILALSLAACGNMEDLDAPPSEPTAEETTGDLDLSANALTTEQANGLRFNPASSAASGSDNPGPNEVILCRQKNFSTSGPCRRVPLGLFSHLMFPGSGGEPLWPQNTVSSIKVGSNVRAALCDGVGFSGNNCRTFERSARVPDFGAQDDQFDSMRVIPQSWADCRTGSPPAQTAFVYKNPNFQGDCATVPTAGVTSLVKVGFPTNDLSSIKVGDLRCGVYLYDYAGLGGTRVLAWRFSQIADMGASFGFDNRTDSMDSLGSNCRTVP